MKNVKIQVVIRIFHCSLFIFHLKAKSIRLWIRKPYYIVPLPLSLLPVEARRQVVRRPLWKILLLIRSWICLPNSFRILIVLRESFLPRLQMLILSRLWRRENLVWLISRRKQSLIIFWRKVILMTLPLFRKNMWHQHILPWIWLWQNFTPWWWWFLFQHHVSPCSWDGWG